MSRLLQLVEQGEQVFIARDGQPIAELVRVAKKPFPFGIGRGDRLVNQDVAAAAANVDWWRMTDDEIAEWQGPVIPRDEIAPVKFKGKATSRGKS